MKDRNQFKILIIEDDLDLLEIMRETFAQYFSNLSTACDGASAYLALRDEKFDLVISDLRMPGFSGLELLTHVRAEGHQTPFILVSGAAEKEDMTKALKLGVKDFIEKPYSMDKIIETTFSVIEIIKRETSVKHLAEQFGEEDDRVHRQQKMIGLFQAVSATKRTV